MEFAHFAKSRKKRKNNGIFLKWKPITLLLGTRAEKRLQRIAKCYARNTTELNLEYRKSMFKALKSKILAGFVEWRRGRSLLKAVQAEKKITPSIKRIVDKDIKQLWFSAWEATIVVALF